MAKETHFEDVPRVVCQWSVLWGAEPLMVEGF